MPGPVKNENAKPRRARRLNVVRRRNSISNAVLEAPSSHEGALGSSGGSSRENIGRL